jgi:hypothetical protein
MRFLFSIAVLLLLLPGTRAGAQVTMLLERPGTIKYYMYQKGDHIWIMYKKGDEGFRDAGEITAIDDSTVQINNLNRYNFRDISSVYRPRFFPRLLSRTAFVFGTGYLALTVANQAINSSSPLVDEKTLLISGISLGIAGIAAFFEYRKFELGENWRLRTIDLSIIRPSMQK